MAANYVKTLTTKKGWTKQPNSILHDNELTSDAKVVIYELLSVTGDYNISIKGISKTTNLSEAKVKRAVKLLQDVGYLQIVKVRNGKYFAGYKWLFADAPGAYRKCTDGISMDGISIPATSNYENSMDGISKDEMSMDAPLYQQTNNEHTNNEKQKNEQTKWMNDEEREFTPTLTPLNQSGESIISSGEVNTILAFNRFCEVYPKVGDKDSARDAFLAIPDIDKICNQIVNSVEWFEKSGVWDNWTTGQKNVSCPFATKFLTRGDWQEYLKSNSSLSTRDRLQAILSKESTANGTY